MSSVAVGKLQVGIVSSVIKGEEREEGKCIKIKVVMINTLEKGDDEVRARER